MFREDLMIINHNMSAIFAERQLKVNNWALDKNMEKLSSGSRIARAGDDASGLAVSEKMRSQIRGLRQASDNAANGISFIQTAEGYLQETQDIMQRLRELSVQASNGIYTDEDRMQIQVEVSQLVDEVDRIASHAQFNGMNMLTGRFARLGAENVVTASMWLHIGANMDQRERVYIGTMTSGSLGLRNIGSKQMVSLSTPDGANRTIGIVDAGLKAVSKQRADLGAYQNRLEHAVKGLDVGAENLQAAESRIRDANMASEMVEYTKNVILTQSATAMLAQANTKPRTVLQLLQ
jgi:flagellin